MTLTLRYLELAMILTFLDNSMECNHLDATNDLLGEI